MAQVAHKPADLASVMRIVLHEICEPVDRATRHSLHARLTGGKSRFEQAREILGRPFAISPSPQPLMRDRGPVARRGAAVQSA
jgi:hypothetical protein